MAESILGVSKITLFGRVVDDIAIKPAGKKKFARVYGFTYGGAYFDLSGPTMFLVEGDGIAANKVKEPGPGYDDDDPFYKDLKAWTCDQNDSTVRLWNVEDGTELRRYQDHLSHVYCVKFVDGGSKLATASADGTVQFLDLKTGDRPERITQQELESETGLRLEGDHLKPITKRVQWHIESTTR